MLQILGLRSQLWFKKFIDRFWESLWSLRKTIVSHLQSKYIFIWIFVALSNNSVILSLRITACSYLPVFPLRHHPSHIPWDSERLPVPVLSPTPGHSDCGWAFDPRRPIRIFPWMFICGHTEKKSTHFWGCRTDRHLEISSPHPHPYPHHPSM